MAHPLELSYRWQTPVVVSSVGAILLTGVVIRSGSPGRASVVAVVLGCWLALLLVVWLRTRAYLMVDGPTLTVRRYRRLTVVTGSRVQEVREYLTAHGPCYRLRVEGLERPVHVPTGLLRGGHRAFFGWLAAHAPQAELDRRSARTRTLLAERGLLP